LFTHIFGFGPLPGVLALILLTIGFAGKLFSEEIEGIRVGPVEAMQATGAGRIQVMYYGVLPQVKTAWVGITIYNWDSTFRAATIVGFVGAGGIGAYLRETIGFMEYSDTGALIIAIIALVIFSELLSAYIRDKIK
jgi:phosphonate transport system permease protein